MMDMENFEEKEQYRNKIIELVKKINNQEFLKFLYEMLLSFKKKWDI